MTVEAALPLRSAKVQVPVILTGIGHAATHWTVGTFYFLLPMLRESLGLDYVAAGLLVTCFHIGSTAINIPSGTLVDLTGRRVLFQVASLVVGAAALAAIGIFGNYGALAIALGVLGASNMLWHPAAISYLSGHLPRNRGYALAIHALGANIGDAMAPLATGLLLASFTWQTTATINAAIGVLPAVALISVLGRGDAAAAARGAGTSLRSYLAGMARAIRTRAMWSLCLMAGFRTMMQSGLLAFLPLYLSDSLHMSPFNMGLTLMMLQVGGMIAAPIAGTLSDRIGRRPIVLAGMSSTTVLVIGLTFLGSGPLYVFGVAVLGFVMYAMRPVIHSWLMDRSPPELAASMTSAMFGVQAAFSAVMPLIGGALADAYGLVAVFYFLGASVLVANLLALSVPKTERAA
ncbi:MAG TPA: MFS transporter [Stellaceae bacterium]|nr:MFS transporter [Stellaceae bacterium]